MLIASNYEIQEYVESTYGFVPKPSWIAEVKEPCHIPHQREAPNRIGKERQKSNPCPKGKSTASKKP